ncbi:pyruvate dehydrogenase E2 component (dihydrolipoamide acetyltransferase) [Panacagrimonas perspica]|uniref:Dihydrolipoamide acetyltransferase component of pyruvate dehydrogenase complex n=1 Tax=Panacagrimonas perspica TaxID=381431 RepID=A0A4R7NZ98_9GAMM|nr:dihydrolipoamide acetyltransferase family protein [Panacagrimonas perspica]TDU25890.1 pyruvate dehydrogenase E2 component (dihydrolipoamide acetyltransferase) [Panacagrimonas perspica]THD02748.1 branched-chain alpha-keto acid dehydrogenase subunit E2 [Panacagrimonas perspica]
MSVFKLPDLGEGLQEAEIREWLVKEGDTVKADQPLVSVETDKAVVEVPSPQAGRIAKLHGGVGDTIEVGKALVTFEGGAPSPATAAKPATSHAPPQPPAPAAAKATAGEAIRDTGVVVGAMTQNNEVVTEKVTSVGSAAGLKVAPAVRALAHRLNVDLTIITPSGPDGIITAADVQRVHKILAEVGPLEKLKGARKAMANAMSQARDEVMPTTLMDDAVLRAWGPQQQDVTLRLIRAIVSAARREPALNAWFDHAEVGRRLLDKVHLGVAVDTPEGLFVCVMQDVGNRDGESLRRGLDKMKTDARNRTVPPEELRGYTITLSNFGRFGGRYATPVIVPPTVAIVAAGAVRSGVIALDGQAVVSPVLPLSLTFDHRAVTGGEAARFLAAMLEDLALPT